jgi:uroporphyrinogen decarboxylase
MWDRFLRACRREPVDATPVWFMRQAGRYMAEYRKIREKHTLLDICRTPEIALEVTLQPLRAFEVDAAILFADILLPLEPMGAPFEFAAGEGPVIHQPIRSAADVDRLRLFEPEEGLPHVLAAIRLLRRELDGKKPLIGFGGGPFTLASYLIEGGKSSHFMRVKRFMYDEPQAFSVLMQKLAEVVRRYLLAQVTAGAHAIQLFDSWVGCLSPRDYREYVLPHVHHVLAAVAATGVPVIHFGTDTGALLELQREAGGTVIGVDWRTPLEDVLAKRVADVLASAGTAPGHVFNLGHGILPETNPDAVRFVAEEVHARSQR